MANYDRSKMTPELMAISRKFAERPGLHLNFTEPEDRSNIFVASPVQPFFGMSFAAFVQTGAGSNGQRITIALYSGSAAPNDAHTGAVEMHQGDDSRYIAVKQVSSYKFTEISVHGIRYTPELDGQYVWLELKLEKPNQCAFYINDKLVLKHGDVDASYLAKLREQPKIRYHEQANHKGRVYELHWTRIDGGIDGVFPTDATLLKGMFSDAPDICTISAGGKVKLKGKYAKKNDNSPNGIEIFVVDIDPATKKSEGYAKHTLKDATPDKVQTILVTLGGTGAQVFSEKESVQMTSQGLVSGMRSSVLKFDNFEPISVSIETGMKKFGATWGV